MSIWDANPRLWHTHPLTQPIGLVIVLVIGLLAFIAGQLIAWWQRRPIRPKRRRSSN